MVMNVTVPGRTGSLPWHSDRAQWVKDNGRDTRPRCACGTKLRWGNRNNGKCDPCQRKSGTLLTVVPTVGYGPQVQPEKAKLCVRKMPEAHLVDRARRYNERTIDRKMLINFSLLRAEKGLRLKDVYDLYENRVKERGEKAISLSTFTDYVGLSSGAKLLVVDTVADILGVSRKELIDG